MIPVISLVLMAVVCLMALVAMREQLRAIRNTHERLLDRWMARSLAEYHAHADEPDEEADEPWPYMLRSPDGLIEVPLEPEGVE